MRKTLLATSVALGLAIAGSSAQALTITETTDFSNISGSPTALGTLDLGSNTISGVLALNCDPFTGSCAPPLQGDGTDFFTALIGAGTELTDVTLNVTSLSGGSLSVGAPGGGAFLNSTGSFDLLSMGSETGTAAFSVFLNKSVSSVDSVARYSFDLTVSEIPAAVPLPAGLPLLLAGLGGLTMLRKRKTA